MKNKVEKEFNKREKRLDLKGLFKSFISGGQEDLSEEEVILNDATLTQQEKDELLAGMKSTETLAHNLFAERMSKAAGKIQYNTKNNNTRVNLKTNSYNRKQKETGERVD